MMHQPAPTPESALIALADEIPPLFFRLRTLAERLHLDVGMTAAMRAVLRDIVERGALTVPELAAMRSVTRQAVQPIVDDLMAGGLATTVPNPRHKRSLLIAATPSGQTRHEQMRAAELVALRSFATAFDPQQLSVTLDTLCALSNALKQALPDDVT